MNHSRFRARGASISASRQSGFSLIELMVVVAIIAILAMIAMPQYQSFAAKSKLSGALAELAGGKVGVEALYAEGSVSTDPKEVGLPTVGSRCTKFDVTMGVGGTASLVCTVATDAKWPTGAEIRLSRSDEGAWKCTGTAPDNLLPAPCRV